MNLLQLGIALANAGPRAIAQLSQRLEASSKTVTTKPAPSIVMTIGEDGAIQLGSAQPYGVYQEAGAPLPGYDVQALADSVAQAAAGAINTGH